jgi:ABC-type transport system involved in multi-copper enzyme maturation permease subunit
MRAMKGLLWKEWRQYYWSFVLAFIVIALQPVLVPITYWIYRTGNRADAWSDGIKTILATGSSTTETIAIIAVIVLAALMLAGERGSGLNYLVSTPVSRRQIITAKYIVGSLGILAIMLFISIFLIVAGQVLPAQYSAQEVIQWAVPTTAALLCLFSLALLVASFSGGILSSALFTTIIMGLPWILLGISLAALRQFHAVSAALELKARYIVTYLFIPDYITRDGRHIWSSNSNQVIDRVTPDYPLEITLLLLASLLFFWLAIKIFEKNPLERQGELLLFGNFKQIGAIFLSFLSALGWAGDVASSLTSFLAYFLVMWLGIYLVLVALMRVIAWLGLSRARP